MRRNPARNRRAPRPRGLGRDPYALYEAAVQGADYDLDFMERVYRSRRGRPFRLLREDFCATALLAGHWVTRRPGNRAWGVDLDPRPLAWCRRHRLPALGEAARRLVLLRRDVRAARSPRVDVVAALNFSYWVFKRRSELLAYFRGVRRSLEPGGIFVTNAFGGTEAMAELVERRRIAAGRAVDGSPTGPFTYVWEQASFNTIDHHLVCHIHFRFRDGTQMKRAFTYDWRLWTLPEIQDAMLEAGFKAAKVYVEGWDDRKNEADEVYRLRKRFTNQEAWLAYCVGLT